ncbi:glutamate receptor ionotropic, kainate 2-like [Condylostylus longicornis]|uniref:glutamate receptor ionotropic, kainate 2-like n=1 Tax=Condylostylus longicornis TaxID=2530218 RepID=UPI00244E47AC|nr:glutamate receptor ionotropic, kainate 2-like [Condylostylus longicornis]
MILKLYIKNLIKCFILILQITIGAGRKQFNIGAIFESENDEFDVAFRDAVDRTNTLERSIELIPIVKYADQEDTFSIEQKVCELISEDVIAIFGPSNADASDIVSSICHSLEIPHILFTYKIRNPIDFREFYSMTINIHPDESALGRAYSAIVTSFSWRRYCIVYERHLDFIHLQDVLGLPNTEESRITFRELQYDDSQQYLPFLKDLKYNQEMTLVVNIANENIIPFLKQAQEMDMVGEYQSFFLMPLDAHTLDFEELITVSANITTMRIIDPTDFSVKSVLHDIEQRERSRGNYFKTSDGNVKTNMLLVYDAVWVFARGLAESGLVEDMEPPTGRCDDPTPWPFGRNITDSIKNRKEEGSTGRIDITEHGKRVFFTTQILELTEDGFAAFATWNPLSGVENIGVEESAKRKEGKLASKIFIVSSRIGKPFLFDLGKDNSSLTGNARYEGYSMDLIDEISQIVGFKYEFVLSPDGKYGAFDKSTGKWNGIVGQVMEGKADMGICDLTMTSARRTVVDFTPPFMTLGISILYIKADPVPPDLFSFRLPFSADVWKYTSAAYLGISLMVFVTARIAPDEWENPSPQNPEPEELENIWTIKNTVWLAMGSIMGQGCDLLPKSASTRILTGMWWFFALMMLNSYTANLAAFLTNSQIDTSIKNVEDLAKQTEIKYGAVAGGSTQGFFKNSDDALYQKMWSFMDAEDPSVWTETNDLGVERIKKSKRKYAFFMESTTLEYIAERDCNLYQVGKWLDYKTYGIAMPFNSPWRKQISEAMLKLGETGKLVELKRRWWKEKYGGGECPAEAGGGDSLELRMGNVGGVFLALGIGLIAAFIIGFIEYFYSVQSVALEQKISMSQAFIDETMFALKFWETKKPVRTPKSESKTTSSKHSNSSSDSIVSNRSKSSSRSSSKSDGNYDKIEKISENLSKSTKEDDETDTKKDSKSSKKSKSNNSIKNFFSVLKIRISKDKSMSIGSRKSKN